jgi:hypothetical protein
MLFLPIIILSLAFSAEEDLAIETYCVSSVEGRQNFERKLRSILVPSDKIQSEKNCVTIQMRPHRRELIQGYARHLDENLQVKFSSAEEKRDPCLIKVEKVRKLHQTDTHVGLGAATRANEDEKSETGKDVMQIQTLGQFSFTVAQDVIEGNCKFINQNLYEIALSARRNPLPLVPPNLPPGSIVVVPSPPANQKTLSVSTTLQLARGSRIEIGSLIKDLRKKDHDVSIEPEAEIQNSIQSEEEKVFLSFQ